MISTFQKMMKEKKTQNSSRKKSRKQSTVQMGEQKSKKKNKFGLSSIKSKFEHTVNAKKILHFIIEGTKTIPTLLTKQQSKSLLPKLSNIALQSKEKSLNMSRNRVKTNFIQAENDLRQSMVMFTRRQIDGEAEQLEMIEVQTKKCYKSIPSLYFNPNITPEELSQNLKLSKNTSTMKQHIYAMMDYSDEVQFNINQQVGAKIRIFTNFVKCMDSLQHMVILNTEKIGKARAYTSMLRDIIVSRSIRIDLKRLKQQRLSSMQDFLTNLKKMKQLESKLFMIIQTGNIISYDSKVKSGGMYKEYCEIHNENILKFCCKSGKSLCKYWDLAYFVEKGFQETFIKNIKNYIFEIIRPHHDIESFKRQFSINKKNFSTTPATGHSFSSSFVLDQSYQVDAFEHIELLVKNNVQKQISHIFQQGMHRYSCSTDVFALQLKNLLDSYLNQFLYEILNQVNSSETITIKNLIQVDEQTQFFLSDQCNSSLKKISWGKYEKILQILSNRFQHINVRIFSVVDQLIYQTLPLEKQEEERYDVISTYLIQLAQLVISFSDRVFNDLVRTRLLVGEKEIKSKGKSLKQFDLKTQNMKSVIKYCKKWQAHLKFIKTSYKYCVKELQKSLTKNNQKLFQQILKLKADLVKCTYQNMHQSITDSELKQKVEEDNWQIIEINPKIHESLGYIMGGNQFILQNEQAQKQLLPQSLLLQKQKQMSQLPYQELNSSYHYRQSKKKYQKTEYSSKFKVNLNYITLGNFKFKITLSTEAMIQFLKHYLELYDDTGQDEVDRKSDLHFRITEIILKYNEYIRNLILKSEAIKLGKINAKTIGAKHLLIAYVQLQIIDLIFCGEIMQDRINISEVECSIMHEKLNRTKNQIKAKFIKVIEMRIMFTVKDLNYWEDSIFVSEELLSISKNIRASIELFESMFIDPKEIQGFIDVSGNWVTELASKFKSKEKERKNKVIKILQSQLEDYLCYMPKTKAILFSIIS